MSAPYRTSKKKVPATIVKTVVQQVVKLAEPLVRAKPNNISTPGHTGRVFDPVDFRHLVDESTRALRTIYASTPFDGIVGCGNSGNVLCGALSYNLGIPMVTVRKECEVSGTHHGYHVTGLRTGRVIFIDDVIASGATLRHVIRHLKHQERFGMKFDLTLAGVMLYQSSYYWQSDIKDQRWAGIAGENVPRVPLYYLDDVLAGRLDRA